MQLATVEHGVVLHASKSKTRRGRAVQRQRVRQRKTSLEELIVLLTLADFGGAVVGAIGLAGSGDVALFGELEANVASCVEAGLVDCAIASGVHGAVLKEKGIARFWKAANGWFARVANTHPSPREKRRKQQLEAWAKPTSSKNCVAKKNAQGDQRGQHGCSWHRGQLHGCGGAATRATPTALDSQAWQRLRAGFSPASHNGRWGCDE